MSLEKYGIVSVRAFIIDERGVLVLHRTDTGHASNNGRHENAGGKVERKHMPKNGKMPGVRVLQDTLAREVDEETGLTVVKIGGFQVAERRLMTDRAQAGKFFLSLVAFTEVIPGEINLHNQHEGQPQEHDQYAHINEDNVNSFNLTLAAASAFSMHQRGIIAPNARAYPVGRWALPGNN
jgi:8-oxo-dGTP pyrophosphatase MutT (NUDIX family)